MLKIKVLVCLLFNWTLLIAKGPLLLAAPIMIVKGIKKYIGDPMRTHIAITLVIGLLAVLPVSSQQPQTTNPAAQAPADVAKPSPNSAQSDVDKGKDSTIVFFREHHYTGSALKPSIYVDGKETDRLANGHWFSVHAEPGKQPTSVQRQERTGDGDPNSGRRNDICADGDFDGELAWRWKASAGRRRRGAKSNRQAEASPRLNDRHSTPKKKVQAKERAN